MPILFHNSGNQEHKTMEVGLQPQLLLYNSYAVSKFACHLLLTSVRKHVLCDLQPYLCTFEGCSTQMFQSRHEWFQHELDKHRKEWHCCLCSNELPFSSAAQLEGHLHNIHSEYSREQTSALLSLCEKPPENIPISACPFCAGNSSGSIDAANSFSMASGSLTKGLWDPYRILGVNPNDSNFTCVGLARSTGSRCRWSFNSEQFNASRRDNAVKRLRYMSEVHPSEITPAALYSLARDTLCLFHQRQADAKSTEWKARIEYFLHKHSESRAIIRLLRQLEYEPPGVEYELPDAKQLLNVVAKDRDASKQEKIEVPSLMVSSLQFQKHVAQHFEQLALFAIPLAMKESSGPSSNQAAASHNSDHTA